MTDSLDVLLIEADRGAGLQAASRLEAGGHRVHRCFPLNEPADPQAEVCVAVSSGTCPIDNGLIDVAVVAGPLAENRPAMTTAGVTCALRRHVPLVADDTCRSSFGSHLAGRANGDIAEACQRAAIDALAGFRADILSRLNPTFAVHGLNPADMGCRIDADGPRLTVTVTGPAADRSMEQAIGVRVLDAIRAADRVFGQVNVCYESTD